ncbi:MAG: zinc carboxypeptidase [Elusimicrobia bacterium]|nr:zinc carboxypeptidase [Elusimicrobiota bacterium]
MPFVKFLVPLFLLLTPRLLLHAIGNEPQRFWIKVAAQTREDRTRIQDLGASIENIGSDFIEGVATGEAIERMREAGLNVLSARNLLDFEPKDFPDRDAAYHNYEETLAEMQAIAAIDPQRITLFSIGKSLEGRELWALRFGPNPAPLEGQGSAKAQFSQAVTASPAGPRNDPEGEIFGARAPDALPGTIFLGNYHAREHLTAEVCLKLARYLAEVPSSKFQVPRSEKFFSTGSQPETGNSELGTLLENREVFIVPMVNPDGVEFDIEYHKRNGRYQMQRKNRAQNPDGSRGVDLNRNHDFGWGGKGASPRPSDETYMGPAPFSEPETQAVRDFIEAHPNIRTLLTFHSYSELILYPWGHKYDPIDDADDLAVFEKAARTMAKVNGYTPQPSSDLYLASGDTVDWFYGKKKGFGFTFELSPKGGWGGGGFYPGPDLIQKVFDANLAPCLYLIDIADDPHKIREPGYKSPWIASTSGGLAPMFFPFFYLLPAHAFSQGGVEAGEEFLGALSPWAAINQFIEMIISAFQSAIDFVSTHAWTFIQAVGPWIVLFAAAGGLLEFWQSRQARVLRPRDLGNRGSEKVSHGLLAFIVSAILAFDFDWMTKAWVAVSDDWPLSYHNREHLLPLVANMVAPLLAVFTGLWFLKTAAAEKYQREMPHLRRVAQVLNWSLGATLGASLAGIFELLTWGHGQAINWINLPSINGLAPYAVNLSDVILLTLIPFAAYFLLNFLGRNLKTWLWEPGVIVFIAFCGGLIGVVNQALDFSPFDPALPNFHIVWFLGGALMAHAALRQWRGSPVPIFRYFEPWKEEGADPRMIAEPYGNFEAADFSVPSYPRPAVSVVEPRRESRSPFEALGIPVRGHGGARRGMTLAYGPSFASSSLSIEEPHKPRASAGRPANFSVAAPARRPLAAAAGPALVKIEDARSLRVEQARKFKVKVFHMMLNCDLSQEVRFAAAETFAALAGEGDLNTAKNLIKDDDKKSKYDRAPEIQALTGLLMIALHGAGDQEEQHLFLTGLKKIPWIKDGILNNGWIVRTLAGYLTRHIEPQELYNLVFFENYPTTENLYNSVFYLALCGSLLPDAEPALRRLASPLFEYDRTKFLAVAQKDAHKALYENWKAPQSQTVMSLPLFCAISLWGGKDQFWKLDNIIDFEHRAFMTPIEHWKSEAAQAWSDMIKRLGLWENVRHYVNVRLKENTYTLSNYVRLACAIKAAGEFGDLDEARALWDLLGRSSGAFQHHNQDAPFHAARAWAQIIVRLGKEKNYFALEKPAAPAPQFAAEGPSAGVPSRQALDAASVAPPKTVLEFTFLENQNPARQIAALELLLLMAQN